MNDAQSRLKGSVARHCLEVGPVILSHIGQSWGKIHLDRLPLESRALYGALGAMMISEHYFDVEAVGGLDSGAREVASAISYHMNSSPSVFRVTKAGQVLGDLRPGEQVVISDDVATTGMSLLKAIKVVRGCGAEVIAAFVVVDRREGAEKLLSEHGVHLLSLLTFTAEDALSSR